MDNYDYFPADSPESIDSLRKMIDQMVTTKLLKKSLKSYQKNLCKSLLYPGSLVESLNDNKVTMIGVPITIVSTKNQKGKTIETIIMAVSSVN